ncbi:MAG: ATP synthase subunit I [Oricola sp.]
MTFFQPHDLVSFSPAWFAAALVGLAVGYGAGLLHFRSLKTVAKRIVDGDWTAVLLQVARLAALGLVLFLLTRWGGHVLIAGAAGILLARRRVIAQTGSEL